MWQAFVSIVWQGAPFPAVHRTDRAPGAQNKQPIVPLSRALSQSAGPRGSPSIGCPGFFISFDRSYAPLASPTHRDNLFAEATGKDTPERPAAKRPPAASGPTLHGDAPRCILGERLQTPFAELRDGLAAAGPSLPSASEASAHVGRSVAGNLVRCVAIQSPSEPITSPVH